MSQLSPEQYQEKLSKLTFTNPKLRMFTGFFLNQMDNIFAPLLVGSIALSGPGQIGPKIAIGVMVSSLVGAQIWLATKGYTPSKVLLGRKVIDIHTLEKPSPMKILIRPVVATIWMYVVCGLFMAATMLGAAFSSLFHVQERDRYDSAYNQAVTASMATASAGVLANFFTKYPRLIWLHDTLFKTTVISVPYSEVIAELKGEKPKQITQDIAEKVEHQKAA